MPFGYWLARDPTSSVEVVADRKVISKSEHLLCGGLLEAPGQVIWRVQAALDPCSMALMVPAFLLRSSDLDRATRKLSFACPNRCAAAPFLSDWEWLSPCLDCLSGCRLTLSSLGKSLQFFWPLCSWF